MVHGVTARLEVAHLSKSYGAQRAVDDLSFDVPAGTIFGLLGRNGAGKSTTFSCILGLTRATSGTAAVDGAPVDVRTLERIAYIPEVPAVYGWLTGQEHIAFWRRLYARFDTALARDLAERFDLDLRKRARALSKGNKTVLALVLAFAQRADLLILDEPSSGLDPVMQRELLTLIIEAGAEGTTIVFSSHAIGQVERAAERIGIMGKGRLLLEGDLDTLRAGHKIVEATYPGTPDVASLSGRRGVDELVVDGALVRVRTSEYPDGAVRALQEQGPSSLRILDLSLEELFMQTIAAPPALRTN